MLQCFSTTTEKMQVPVCLLDYARKGTEPGEMLCFTELTRVGLDPVTE